MDPGSKLEEVTQKSLDLCSLLGWVDFGSPGEALGFPPDGPGGSYDDPLNLEPAVSLS